MAEPANVFLQDFHRDCTSLLEYIKQLRDLVESPHVAVVQKPNGISLLDVKIHQLVDYLLNLAYVSLLKFSGKSIDSHPVVERLVELRTVIERIRPVEKKLQYQINKLIQSVNSVQQSADPLNFRARPDNLDNEKEEGESSGEEDTTNEKSKKYVPPKLMAMPYADESEALVSAAKQKRRSLRADLLAELQQEYSEAPEEIQDAVGNRKQKEIEESEHRARYEEEHFVRLQVSKKQLQAERRSQAAATIDSLLGLEHYGDEHDSRKPPPIKEKLKRKSQAGGKAGSKGKKKKRKIRSL